MSRKLTALTLLVLAVELVVLVGVFVAVTEWQGWVPRPHVVSTGASHGW